ALLSSSPPSCRLFQSSVPSLRPPANLFLSRKLLRSHGSGHLPQPFVSLQLLSFFLRSRHRVNGVLLPRPEQDAGEPDGRHLRRGRCPLAEASVAAGARWRRRNQRRGRGEAAAPPPPLGRRRLWRLCGNGMTGPTSLGEFLQRERREAGDSDGAEGLYDFGGPAEHVAVGGEPLFADGRVLPPAPAAERRRRRVEYLRRLRCC
ncbi:unnamed protein product, partial [Musa textilis]